MITIPLRKDKLKELRKEDNKLQMEVERATDIPLGRLTQYETGRANASPIHVLRLSGYFGVDPHVIIDEEGLKELSGELTMLASFIGAELKF